MEIYIVVVMPIEARADVEDAAQAKEIRNLFGITKGEISGVVAAEATSCYCYTTDAGFVHYTFQYFMAKHAVVGDVVLGPFGRGDVCVVPAVGVDAIRAVDADELFFDEPLQGVDQASFLVLVVAAHGGGEEDEGVAFFSEDQHFEGAAEARGLPLVVLFMHMN